MEVETMDLVIDDRVVVTSGPRQGCHGFVLSFGEEDDGQSVEVRFDGSDEEPEYHWEWRIDLAREDTAAENREVEA
jgi:hypothetical protein